MKKQTVKLKFITLEKAIDHKWLYGLDCEGKSKFLTFDNPDCDKYFNIPVSFFGKELTFEKERNQYRNNEFIISHEESCHYFKELCRVTEGSLYPMPIDIDGDLLEYNSENKEFTCGCKTISLEEADEIFKFIGGILGYTIT